MPTARHLVLAGLVLMAVTSGAHDDNKRDRSFSSERPRHTALRTPWGDPDLQGAYTNAAERGIPLERPPGLPVRITQAELKRLNDERREAKRRAIEWEPTIEPPIDNSRPWLVVDPANGRVPQLVPDAFRRARAQADAWLQDGNRARPWLFAGLFERCITRGVPGSMMPFDYGNLYEIVQAPFVVAITYEMVHETRVIPLDGRPHAGAQIRSYLGDPRGHFEGDTLVVETTNLSDKTQFWGSSPNLRLVERFTPVSATVLEWTVTFNDPQTWTAPWTIAMNLTRTDDRPFEYACHEGNRVYGDQ
jgi:hypothetical protein